MASSQSITLYNNLKMPAMGLGTWLSKAGQVEDAVKWAVKAGYRHIDSAQGYGNDVEVGNALQQCFKEGVVKREEIFITSKIWNTFHSYEKCLQAVDMILKDLQLEYLDLCLIHWPHCFIEGESFFPKDAEGNLIYGNTDYMETWRALEKAVDDGKIKSIGLSNFNSQQIQRVIDEGKIHPAALQIELHPYFAQKKIRRFCSERNMAITAFSPLANNAHMFRKEGQPNLLEDPVLLDIGRKYGKTSAQVALRWALQSGLSVIPKSTSKNRIEENFEIFNFSLSTDDMEAIDGLDRNFRILDLTRDLKAPNFPFHIEF